MKVSLKEQLLVMNKTLSLITSVALSISAFYVEAKTEFSGEFVQGGMVVGKSDSADKVTLNKKLLPLTSDGQFVFGFGRDDKSSYTLTIVHNDGKVEKKTFVPKVREYNIQRINGIKKSIMQPNPKAVARSKKDNLQVKQARQIGSELTAFSTGFIAPIQGKITGVYGSQRVFNDVPKRPHFGLDYAGKTGDPVMAPASGKVLLWVPDMFYSGGTMIIDHGHGISSTFLHLSDSYVKTGDMVKQGDVVAAVGASGRATGPHLDWRINWFDVKIDPEYVLKLKAL